MTETIVLQLSPEEAEHWEELRKQHPSPEATIRAAIEELHARSIPALCLGYLQVDRIADVTADDECLLCGNPAGWPFFVAVFADGSISGPYCELCATS